MPNCGDFDRGSKSDGDRIVSLDPGHCGRKGTVVGTGMSSVIVRWDGDTVNRLVSSSSVTLDTSEDS